MIDANDKYTRSLMEALHYSNGLYLIVFAYTFKYQCNDLLFIPYAKHEVSQTMRKKRD